jgi:hypothetical protein
MQAETRDPDSVLDWVWDWSDWLAEGETIVSHEVLPDVGMTVDSSNVADGVVIAWLSGGEAGKSYTVTVRITTSQGRTDDRSRRFKTLQR